MISYETAKKLKEAGFEQGLHFYFNRKGLGPWCICENFSDDSDDVSVPSLSELMKAVRTHPMNRKDTGLYTNGDGYTAWARKTRLEEGEDGERSCLGRTAEEAMALLWLELTKN